MNTKNGERLLIAVADHNRIPGGPETTVHELRGQDEIMVRTPRNSISGPDLVLLLDYIWSRALPRLGLLEPQDAG
jgi:hypothetical protein